MGRASKSWATLVRKAKSLVSFKGLKKPKVQKETGSDIANGLLHDDPEGIVSELGSEDKTFELKLVEKESAATESLFPDTPTAPKATELQRTEPAPSTVHDQPEERHLFPPPSAAVANEEQQERAAVKIQAAFRGAMARKRLRAMKAMERLRSVLHGKATKKQTSNAMRCMQSYAKMQSQLRVQRSRLAEFQLQQRKEEEAKRTEEDLEDWDDSTLSKEQLLAKVRSKHQAAAKRERTLAYAFSHQLWRSYPRDLIPPPIDDEKPAWTWNWLEQWMSTRSWKCLEEGSVETNCKTVVPRTPSPTASPLRKFPRAIDQPRSPLPNGRSIPPPRFYASPQRNTSPNRRSFDRSGSKSPAWKGATKSSSPLYPAAGGTKSKSLLQRGSVLSPNHVKQSPRVTPADRG